MMISLVLAEIGTQDPYFSTNSTPCLPHSLLAQAAPTRPRPAQLPPRYAPGHLHPRPRHQALRSVPRPRPLGQNKSRLNKIALYPLSATFL